MSSENSVRIAYDYEVLNYKIEILHNDGESIINV